METQSSEEQQVLIPINESRIDVKGSKCYWEKNPNIDAWFLEKEYFNVRPRGMMPLVGSHTFGFVCFINFGENEGKFQADIPMIYDEDTESDSKNLGFFNTLELAMIAVLKSNHPDWDRDNYFF